MFSKRTCWNQDVNDLHVLLEDLHLRKIFVIDATQSNPTQCGFEYPPHWMSALSRPENLTYDPQSSGLLSTREAVGRYNSFDPSQILLTASTSESYAFLFRLLLNPGDHVLIPRPSYPLFQFLLDLNDATYDYYSLRSESCWSIDFESLERLVAPRTKVIVLVNPNNPTGSFMKPDEISKLNVFCQKHQLVIISDEVFLDYRLIQKDFASLKGNAEVLTFTLGGLSKALALPQMKLGWILTSGPEAERKEALARLDLIADTFLSVNTPVQHAAEVWLSEALLIQRQIKERVKRNFDFLCSSGLKVLPIEGGWYATIEISGIEEETFVLRMLKEHHVLLHPGFFFDFIDSSYVVVSLLLREEQFDKMVEILRSEL